jgi:glycine cleavage system H protein
MSNIPSELKYTSSHEWIRDEGNGIVTVGITEHAQGLLGDMVFVDLPDVGDEFAAGDDCAVAESVKAASDIYAPVAGQIVEVNEELEDSPENVNSDPYGDGWMFKIKMEDPSELDDLLDAEGYEASIDEE